MGLERTRVPGRRSEYETTTTTTTTTTSWVNCALMVTVAVVGGFGAVAYCVRVSAEPTSLILYSTQSLSVPSSHPALTRFAAKTAQTRNKTTTTNNKHMVHPSSCHPLGLQRLSQTDSVVQLPRLPNHAKSIPGSQVWVPDSFSSVPVLPDSALDAGLARAKPGISCSPNVHRMLLRLWANETIRIQVWGGSMTAGASCCCKFGVTQPRCTWASQFVNRIRETFPSATVLLENLSRGGCDIKCGIPNIIMTQLQSKHAPDMVIFDYDQNGLGDIEGILRVAHFFLPSTLFVILWTGPRLSLRSKGDGFQNRSLEFYAKVAQHYCVQLISYSDAEDHYANNFYGNYSDMWNQGLEEGHPYYLGENYHHPPWTTHAYIADLLARWLNVELATLETCNLVRDKVSNRLFARPVLRHPSNFTVDDNWIRPLSRMDLSSIQTCLFPLTTHVAHLPQPESPHESLNSSWHLFEDRPGKPGWITNTTNDWITFPVNFSSNPRLIIAYLRSYENIGEAEVVVDSPAGWLVYGVGGKRSWGLDGHWPDKISTTETKVFQGRFIGNHVPLGAIRFRLVKGPNKFKIISVISC
ncbi:unnamed protein product [Polarella glacialis]|uniref:Uncharacterized protein n=1 Tax=Polarella glacialis TaxID=89957 RepID=A0A813ER47_POLGL|nr:unnamed protein product [Polarella glacialis]